MPISVACSECGKNYTVKDDVAGRKFKCKDCGAVISVPSLSSEAEEDFGLGEEDWETGESLPPVTHAPRRSRSSNGSVGAAMERLKAPAICLMIAAGLSLGTRVLLLVLNLVGIAMVPVMQQGGADGFNAAQAVGGVVGQSVGLIFNGVQLYGAYMMLRGESLSTARVAAILSVIPCCSPCVILGIPFGIWSLVVLSDPQVKSAFRS